MDFHELPHTHDPLAPGRASNLPSFPFPDPLPASPWALSVLSPPRLPACLLHPAAPTPTLLRLGLARCGLCTQRFSQHPLPFSEGRPTLPLLSPLSTSSQFSLPLPGLLAQLPTLEGQEHGHLILAVKSCPRVGGIVCLAVTLRGHMHVAQCRESRSCDLETSPWVSLCVVLLEGGGVQILLIYV